MSSFGSGGFSSPGRWPTSPGGRPDLPSSHTHLHESLLQVRYEAEDFERGPELPATYGLDRCVLLVKEPETILCYWELAGGALEAAQRALTDAQFRRARPVLRLITAEGEERERRDLAPFRPGERMTYFSVQPDREYRVELGLDVEGERFIRVLSSNMVAAPRRPS